MDDSNLINYRGDFCLNYPGHQFGLAKQDKRKRQMQKKENYHE